MRKPYQRGRISSVERFRLGVDTKYVLGQLAEDFHMSPAEVVERLIVAAHEQRSVARAFLERRV